MKKIIALALFLLTNQAFAQWSALAIITPDSQSRHKGLLVESTALQTANRENCTIKFKADAVGYPLKQAWLAFASRPLTADEQKLREYIWAKPNQPSSTNQREIAISALKGPFVSITPIEVSHPTQLDQVAQQITSVPLTTANDDHAYYELTISRTSAKAAYIYVDFPSLIADGGYYYSIDVGAFCARAFGEAAQKM